jgi:hypothetical protein
VSRVEEYRASLRALPAGWEPYLEAHSGLPGPRGNIELAQAVAEEATSTVLRSYSRRDDEFLAFCGTVGLGRLLAEGDDAAEPELHLLAVDPRWRVREAVAMALQRLGDADESRMLSIAEKWAADSSLLVRRAAIAGVCEPRLLTRSATPRILGVLDLATQALADCAEDERRSEPFRVLRQALAYCWSVAVAASPVAGFDRFQRWEASRDRDVRWMMRKNLAKARMRKAGPERCVDLAKRVASSAG